MEKKDATEFKIAKLVEKSRSDVALANPVGFMIRAMNGEEFDGERLKLWQRVEIAKFLGSKMLPVVQPEEIGVGKAVRDVTPAPLTIVLHQTNNSTVSGDNMGAIDNLRVVGEDLFGDTPVEVEPVEIETVEAKEESDDGRLQGSVAEQDVLGSDDGDSSLVGQPGRVYV